jgi:hypothetical protein
MKPCLVTVVCPLDNDVIEDMLYHYLNIGIKDFYIMLHKPDLGLESIVKSFYYCTDYDVKVICKYNMTDEHIQEQSAMILVDTARQDGCDWIIPSDADEILILKKLKTIQEFLLDCDKSGSCALRLRWRDIRSHKDTFENAFTKMKYARNEYMDESNKNWMKVIGKFDDKMSYSIGYHIIYDADNQIYIDGDIAEYKHYPYRNLEQFKKKIRSRQKLQMKRFGKFYLDENTVNNDDLLFKEWQKRLVKSDNKNYVYEE